MPCLLGSTVCCLLFLHRGCTNSSTRLVVSTEPSASRLSIPSRMSRAPKLTKLFAPSIAQKVGSRARQAISSKAPEWQDHLFFFVGYFILLSMDFSGTGKLSIFSHHRTAAVASSSSHFEICIIRSLLANYHASSRKSFDSPVLFLFTSRTVIRSLST
jgi:hypothetical protein